jgi:hypothetical protein
LYDHPVQARLAIAPWVLGRLLACSGAAPRPTCLDVDNDGYGPGCAKGPDCDDHDASRAADCSDAGALESACDQTPVAVGCPCLRGDRSACYDAAPETQGVGLCQAGKAICLDGAWSTCDGEQLPDVERCNALDDDCDGFIDEGVQSPCGGCNVDCVGGVWGPPAAPFDVASPLALTAYGELTLERTTHVALTLWVPNTDEGSVSKLDVVSARELARYRTRGGYPIRVAVDHRGDAWVLDAAANGDAYVTKIAGAPERCRDRNGDGVRTAQSASDVLPLGADECVLLELPLAAADDAARALALDGEVAPDSERAGNVWVGLAGAQRLLTLDGETGALLTTLELPGFSPQAGAFDPFGVLWLIDRAGLLARVDPSVRPSAFSSASVPFECYALDALSIDAAGKLLLSGSGCENLFSYDAQRDLWNMQRVPDLLSPRAVVALPDASWVVYTSGQIARVEREPLQLMAAASLASEAASPFETIAVSADTLGQLWSVSTQGGPAGVGVATRFDPVMAMVTAQVPVGMGPRGSGDLSGYSLGGDFAREGAATHVFGGCGREGRDTESDTPNARTEWLSLHIEALLGASASLDLAWRHAMNESALAQASFQMLSDPPESGVFPLEIPNGGVVELRLTLHSPAAIGAPRVARVGLEWRCPGPD